MIVVNIFYKVYCRIYQKIMWCALWLLPWRTPYKLLGENSISKLPKFCLDKGLKKPLLVTDENILKLGLCNTLINNMQNIGIEIVCFSKVVPNPTINNIEDGVKLFNSNGCDHIIAIGGGSSIDCAKGIGARIAKPNKSIPQMKGIFKVLAKLPYTIVVPTTSGTGSEATLAAVISNPDTHEKYAINDVSLIPHCVVMDPLLTVGLPKSITSTTGMDALTHAVEAYIGSSNTPRTKKQALEATQLIFKYLKRAYDNGDDLEARTEMQKASYLAGCAFTRAYVGYTHAMAHTLGGFYGVPHGLANSVLLPVVLESYDKKVYKKLARLADAVNISGSDDEEKSKAFIEAIRDMNKYMDIPEKINLDTCKWYIKEKDLPLMIKRALSEANPLYPCPCIFGYDELYNLYRKIM